MHACINMVVMLLVANGRDFHIECKFTTPRIRHAVSIRELERERVPLSTKLNFLKNNGILELASVIDSKLRNAIAHLEFDVKEDKIYIKGKPASEVVATDLTKLVHALRVAYLLLMGVAAKKGLIQIRRNADE